MKWIKILVKEISRETYDYVRNVQSILNISQCKLYEKQCQLLAAQILNAQKNKGSQAQEYIGGNKNNQ